MADYSPITIARFWSKVDVPDAPRDEDLCWNWKKSTAKGYGQIKVGGKVLRSHRLAHELCNGPIPNGFQVLHSCDNPRCCNPTHLRAGTHTENMIDKRNRRRAWCGGPRKKPKSVHLNNRSLS